MPAPYDEIVSLGLDCRVAYNLRQTFGFSKAYPFDWWVTPLPALVAFLADPSLERLYDPASLRMRMLEGRRFAVLNTHYDIELHHEFPRGEDGAVAEDWAERLEQPKARTAYLLERLLDLPRTAERVLFVRGFHKRERTLRGQTTGLVKQAHEALQRLLPGVKAHLLLIDPVEQVELPGVSSLRIDDPDRSWRGTPSLWRERLTGAGLSRRGGEAAFDTTPERDHEHYV